MADTAGRIVGIDLGTTFSALAYIDARGRPVSVPNEEGELVTPSAVLVRPDRTIQVGSQALLAAEDQPQNVATNVKRDMGEKFYHRLVGGRQFSPEALSALVLKKLVKDAAREIGDVAGAVVTVPAYFGDRRRRATEDAGRIASLNVVDIINEPTAAALANAFRCYVERGGETTRFETAGIAATAPSTTLIFDLGGGTFDVTIIRIAGPEFEVVATGGEVRLGGVDFDARLLDFFCEQFVRRFGVDPRDNEESRARVRHVCEHAKIALSSREQTVMICDHLGQTLHLPITRRQFEDLTADLITRTQISTDMLLQDALLTWGKIDDLLLVGGSAQMPAVRQMLERISGMKPNMAIAPDQIVAHGAAIHAAIIQMKDTAVTTLPDGARRIDSDAASGGPADDEPIELFKFEPSVVEAARQVKLADVNAHSLGVIVRSSREDRIVNSMIIPRNTPLPVTRTKIFGTEAANQRVVRIPVVEGETRDPRGCTQIGECMIQELPPGLPQGSPVEVTFRYDTSGRVHIRAVETMYNTEASADIKRDSGFAPADLDALADAVRELDV
ncbi:MAG: Hsp70 family protein [Phycisphaerales bacterium]|nr:MAG: Hsp70 family protein [Phycisphaerales bacterium]